MTHTQDLSVVSPFVQVVYICRPHNQFTSAVIGNAGVMGTIYVYSVFSRLVRILEHIRLTVRNMLP